MQPPKTTLRFMLLIVSILIMLAIHGADEFFSHLQDKQAQLRQSLDQAVAGMVTNLRAKATTIAQDKSIAKNLTWKLQHAVRKSIANIVADEQVAIFDPQCKPLWGETSLATTRACKNFIVRAQELYVNPKPMTITHSQSASNMVVLISAKVNAPKHADYKLTATNNTVAGLSYQRSDTFLQHLSFNSGFYRQLIAKLQWFCGLLMLLLLINVAAVCHRFNKRVQAAFRYLQNWSSSTSTSTDSSLKSITANLTSEIEKHVQRAAKIEQQCHEQSKKLNAVLRKEKLMQAQLEQQTFMMSALQQVKDLNAYFLNSSRTSKSLAQDLNHSMTSLQQDELDYIFAICQKWEHEFSQRHFVNFLGSYHNSDQDRLLTHLQQDLYQLFAVARSLASAWQNIIQLTQQIDTCAQDLDKPLLHWEQVLTNSKISKLDYSV